MIAEVSKTRMVAVNSYLPLITITPHDHKRLMRTAQELAEQDHPLASPLLQELHRAVLCPEDQLPDDVIALDTFVTYRLSGAGPVEKRALIHPEDRVWPPAEVSVLTPLGLSLLGLRSGDRMPLLGSVKPTDICVEVEDVGPRITSALMPFRV